MKRKCEICGSKKINVLHKQKFILENNYLFNYDVVACKKCGFVFASNLPSPKKLEKFYKKNIKYAYQHDYGILPDYAKKLHLESFNMIDRYLKQSNIKFDKSTLSVLDIGCANGYLLSLFKKKGYKNLLGIDPAPDCSLMAKKLYTLKVLPLTLSEYKSETKFDLIIFASVLEHMNELQNNIKKATMLLKDDGVIFISVPDGNNFGKIFREPFLEFSIEHINYFTRTSLMNLLLKHHLKNIKYNSLSVDLYGGYALNSLWKKNKQLKKIIPDISGKNIIENYIKSSRQKLNNIDRKIKKIIFSKEKIVIWGVGSLTSRLLATTNLKKTNIQFFVDSNVNMQGKKISGFAIKSPEVLRNKKITIFVSTYIHKGEIKKVLVNKFHYKGKIIFL